MLEHAVALVIALALIVYALTGGADFGGGVWDLFAAGPRKGAQRDLIGRAIGPIWEANHVWLIVVVVLLFACFPRAFAVITVALHIPLTLMLVGIVARGAAFVFRSHDDPDSPRQRLWGRIFAVASTVTPVMVGVCAGAVASGALRVGGDGRVLTDFIHGWWAPFPFAVGGLTLALFALLAAIYLAVEAEGDAALQGDFRLRALGAAGAVAAFAALAWHLADETAPWIRAALGGSAWSVAFHLATGAMATAAIGLTFTRRYHLARWAAMAQVALILWGWFVAQYPYIIPPDLTFEETAAPKEVLEPVLLALAAGMVLLIPAFFFLYRVFKGAQAERGG